MSEFEEDRGRDKVVEIEVLEPNWETVRVFRMCQFDITGGMGVSYHGIAAREIEAACNLYEIPAEERTEIADGVRYMGEVVASAINRKMRDDMDRAKDKRKS